MNVTQNNQTDALDNQTQTSDLLTRSDSRRYNTWLIFMSNFSNINLTL